MSRGRRPLAAMLLVVALVAAACSGSDEDPDEAAGTTSTTAEGTAGGGATPSPTPEGWARSTSEALNEGEPAATLNAALAAEDGGDWVLAGTAFDGAGVPRATVWRSDDAITWRATAVGAEGSEGYDVVRRDDGALVVVGRLATGETARAAAWVEDDGKFTVATGGDAFAGGQQVEMHTLAARPAGLVAMGARGDEGQANNVAVWRSADGQSWERVPTAEEVFAAAGQASVNRVSAVPAGFVALGVVRKGDHIDAGTWFSADGASWQAAGASPDFGGAGDQSVEDVVALESGLLAVGSIHDGRRQVPAAWRSPDGKAWSPANAAFDRQGDASDTFGTQVTNVQRISAGLVATGGGAAAQRIWLSEDGTAWQEIPLPLTAYAAENYNIDLLATDGTDVLVASTVDGVPRVLVFRNAEWTEVTARAGGFPAPRPNPFSVEVAAAGSRFAATADVRKAGRALGTERTDVGVFSSTDGLSWEKAAGGPFSRALVNEIGTDASGRLVAVGGLLPARTTPGARTFVTYINEEGSWRRGEVATLPGDAEDEGGSRHFGGAATKGERMVVAGTAFVGSGADGNVDGAVFRKDGSGRLTLVPDVPGLTGPGDEYVNAVCAGPAGFLVAGTVRNGAESDGAAWFSPDGTSWQQVQAPAFGGPGDQAIEDCTVAGPGFVAAGTSSVGDLADAAAWTSPDGVNWTRVESPVFGGDDAQFIDGLAADGPEVVAVGADGRSGEYEAALWHSEDSGATWDRVELGRLFGGRRYSVANSIVVAGDRVVMGGVVDDRVAIWSGPWPLRRVS